MGGSASFNQSKQDASSYGESATDAYGYNTSGGANQATSGQSVWGAQADPLQGLYGQAARLMGGDSQFAQQGQAIAQQGAGAWAQQLQPGSNPYFDASVQASIDQATDSFKRQVLPELESRGVGAGQYGSSRDALARGEAAGTFGAGLAQSVAQQRANQYAGDQGRALQAVSMTPQIQGTAFAPLELARSLIGGPTVLGESQSSGWQQALGEQMSQARSTQGSTSRGRSWGTSGSGGLKE